MGWDNQNTGWVREIYKEIDRWNNSPYNQQIRCGLLYRWFGDKWAIADKGEVQADFRIALDQDRRWRISSAGGTYAFAPGPGESLAEDAPVQLVERALVKPDDLTVLWGVGIKAAGILNAAGIYIFEQLAHTTPERLVEIVGESGLRARFLQTWPEQAGLAVAGEWEQLEQFRDELHKR